MKTLVRTLPLPARSTARTVVITALAALATLAILLIGILANASLLALTACAEPAPERFVLRGERVEICDLAGSVRVVQGTGTRTEVVVIRGGRDGERLRIVADERAGTSRLRVLFPGRRFVYPGRNGGSSTLTVDGEGCYPAKRGHGIGRHRVTVAARGFGLQAWADLEVRVPRGRTTAVYLGVGEAEARGVEGDLTLDVASAPVRVEGTKGRLLVDTGSGRVTLHSCEGDITADTGSGHVELEDVRGGRIRVDTGSGGVTGRGIVADELLVDTGSGGVEAENVRAPVISVDTGSGGVSLGLDSAPSSVLVDTGSGGVTIVGPSDLSAEIELDSGSGGLEVDYALARMYKDHGELRGTIGDGRGRIHVDTGSGAIRLRQR